MKLGTAYIDVRTDDRRLQPGLDTARGKVTKSAGLMQKSIKSINFAAVGVAAAAFAATFAVGISKAISAASDLQEVTSKFETVFRGQEQQAHKWAQTLVNSYAMSRREARQYLSSVQDLLVPMGMQAVAAGKLSSEIVKLSADLGSFNNLPTAQVMDDIQSALVGNFETMKKYGVVLNATVVSERALADGLAETKDGLTAAHKAQAAYKLIVEGSSAAVGDMARTSEGYANQMKKLQSRFEDLKATIGDELLPVATDMVNRLNEWFDDPANQEAVKNFAEQMGAAAEATAKMVGWLIKMPKWVIAGGMGIADDSALPGEGIAYIERMQQRYGGKSPAAPGVVATESPGLPPASMVWDEVYNPAFLLGPKRGRAPTTGKGAAMEGARAADAARQLQFARQQAQNLREIEMAEWEKTTKLKAAMDNWLSNSRTTAVEEFWASAEGISSDAASNIADSLGTNLIDMMEGNFESLDDAWSDLWQSMTRSVAQNVAKMIAETAILTTIDLGRNLLSGWLFAKEGLWEVGRDEQPVMAHAGEMILPKDSADKLRSITDGRDNFDYLNRNLDFATSGPASDAVLRSAANAGGKHYVGAQAALIQNQMAGNGLTVGQVGRNLINPNVITGSIFGAVIPELIMQAAGSTSNWGRTGQFLGTLFGTAAFGPGGGAAGGTIFGILADLLGDLFDARDRESLRDFLEDTFGRYEAAQLAGSPEGTKFNFPVDVESLAGVYHKGGMLGGKKDGLFIGKPGEGVASETGMEALDKLNRGEALGGTVINAPIQIENFYGTDDDYDRFRVVVRDVMEKYGVIVPGIDI